MTSVRIFGFVMLAYCMTSQVIAQSVALPSGRGKDAVEGGFATCHSLAYIPMNSRFLTQAQWQAEVTKMRTAFGAPIDDAAAGAIVAYLAANFAAQGK